MNNTINKYAFWVSIVALILVLGTIVTIIMEVWDISIIDSNSFISGLVALMSLVFTLLVGYQIYNAVDAREKLDAMRNELNKINEFRGDIDKTRTELSAEIETNTRTLRALVDEAKENNLKTENKLDEGILIILARMCANKVKEHPDAFLKMLKAIRCALDVNHKEDGYGWMLDELKDYMLMINNIHPFSGSSDEIPNKIQEYKNCFKEDDKAIRNHDNYYIIRDTYEPLMYDFEKRLNYIAQMKPMSLTEVGECLKTE